MSKIIVDVTFGENNREKGRREREQDRGIDTWRQRQTEREIDLFHFALLLISILCVSFHFFFVKFRNETKITSIFY